MTGQCVPLLTHEKFPTEYLILVKERGALGGLSSDWGIVMPVIDFLANQAQYEPVVVYDH